MTEDKLYNLPKYYDIAFSWDTSFEIELFCKLFKKYVPFEVKKILEPACGTGRFLLDFPKYGYKITGYDNSPKMISYANKCILDEGLKGMASAVIGDMRSIEFNTKFDVAINSINSLGYILSDEDIIEHFRITGESLKNKGIYIVHLSCACDKLDPNEDEGWTLERDGIKIKTMWNIEKEDKQQKISHQICRMEIDDNGEQIILKDNHTLMCLLQGLLLFF